MDIDALVRRQAISEWRDRQILTSWSMINRAGQSALEAFDDLLDEAGILDSTWDPGAFAKARIDRLMSADLKARLGEFLSSAADELGAIHGSFADLSSALGASVESLTLPEVSAPPEKVNSTDSTETDASLGLMSVFDNGIARAARSLGAKASDALGTAADTASKKFQSQTGLHDRLRRSAAERVRDAWLGSKGEPKPLAAQIIVLIDDAGNGARSLSL